MKDARIAAVRRAIEARYPGTRTYVEPWTDPDGDPYIRYLVHVLDVRPAEAGPLRLFASCLALDLFAPDPKPFFLSILGRRNSASFLARKAEEAGRRRARSRRTRRSAGSAGRRRAAPSREGEVRVNDVRMAGILEAIEARYPGTRCVVEPWTDPDGDTDLKWWVHVLNARPRDLETLHGFAVQLGIDLYGTDPKPFTMSVAGKRNTRLYLARKAAEARRDRARLRRAGNRTRAARSRAGGRPARVGSA